MQKADPRDTGDLDQETVSFPGQQLTHGLAQRFSCAFTYIRGNEIPAGPKETTEVDIPERIVFQGNKSVFQVEID